MKPLLLTCLLLAAAPIAQSSEIWRARSIEKLPGNQSGQSIKSSVPLAQSQGANLQQQPAQQLKLRSSYSGPEDFWIYDAWISLISDTDHDGYYSEFLLGFDADSRYVTVPVYARLYLTRGDTFREYHTTSIFTIEGENSEDYFEVSTELLEGFVDDDYELLIELYDGDTNELVAVYDSYNDSDLLYLPLESQEYEYRETHVSVHGGGSIGWLGLLAVALLAACRHWHCKG